MTLLSWLFGLLMPFDTNVKETGVYITCDPFRFLLL